MHSQLRKDENIYCGQFQGHSTHFAVDFRRGGEGSGAGGRNCGPWCSSEASPILAVPGTGVKGLFWAGMSPIRAVARVVGQQCSYIMLPLQPPSHFGLVVKEHTPKGSFEGGFFSTNEF